MKILIDIPEEEYKWIKRSDNTAVAALCSKECMLHAIKNGTPLPEHKGRLMLIDIDELPFFRCPNNIKNCPPYYDFTCQHCDYGITSRFRVERIGTLIESKEEKENE